MKFSLDGKITFCFVDSVMCVVYFGYSFAFCWMNNLLFIIVIIRLIG